MCGIAGYWEKSGDQEFPLGSTLLDMLTALGRRGPDSAGVAMFGPQRVNHWRIRVKLGENGHLADRASRVKAVAKTYGGKDISQTDAYLAFAIEAQADSKEFVTAVESIAEDVEVVSLGSRLEIIKQVGSPANIEHTFSVSKFRGSHGIGHTRLSTESIVDLSHSQPFWAHGFPNLAIVHNGHITNYHQLRRRYQQHGMRFYTENDSEIVAIYLAQRMRGGHGLQHALKSMLVDLDGSFSCIAATESEFGFVRDPFALKPLMFAETDGFVAVANEEIAIRSAIRGDYDVREVQAKEVCVWQR